MNGSFFRDTYKWTKINFSQDSFLAMVEKTHSSDIQSLRGRKGGLLGGVISKGGGRPKMTEEQPWTLEGISRASWYRKGKRKKL